MKRCTEPAVSLKFVHTPLKLDHSHGHPAPNYPVQRNTSAFFLGTGFKCLGVSVSSIYTLCIFTTDQMIRMLVCSDQDGSRNFLWHFQRDNEFIRRYTPLLNSKSIRATLMIAWLKVTFVWGISARFTLV